MNTDTILVQPLHPVFVQFMYELLFIGTSCLRINCTPKHERYEDGWEYQPNAECSKKFYEKHEKRLFQVVCALERAGFSMDEIRKIFHLEPFDDKKRPQETGPTDDQLRKGKFWCDDCLTFNRLLETVHARYHPSAA